MSENNETTVQAQKPNWGAIFTDMAIIMAIMACLAYLCNLLMAPFESVSATDSLVSLIRKGDVSKETKADDNFLMELKKGQEKDAQFVNTQDQTGRTPLMWTAYCNFNDPELAVAKDLNRLYYLRELLKTPGIKPATVDNDGFSALHWAAWSGMPLCALELAEAGLDIDRQESNGYTPLMLAAMRGNDEVVGILLRLGAKTDAVNKDGQTAAQLATVSGNAYSKRGSWMYTLIYSKARMACYLRTAMCKVSFEGDKAAVLAALKEEYLSDAAIEARRKRIEEKEKAKKAEGEDAAEPAKAAPAKPESKDEAKPEPAAPVDLDTPAADVGPAVADPAPMDIKPADIPSDTPAAEAEETVGDPV